MQYGIQAIEYDLPAHQLTNDELAALYPEWTAEKIEKKTGITSRHVTVPGECVSDIARRAAEKLFEKNPSVRNEIDFLILVTQTPDYLLPTTACILQNELGLSTSCGAIDVNLGCSGFIYGLKLAKSLCASGEAQKVLLITGDMYSRHIHPMDKSTRTIFGDGAAAALIGEGGSTLGVFDIGTDGAGYDRLIIPAGGSKLPHSAETAVEETDDSGCVRTLDNIFMNGAEIFNFSIDAVPLTIAKVLQKNDRTLESIDWFVFHQANKYMLDFLRKKLRIPPEKFIVDMADTGNTVSATIPIALKRSDEKGLFKPKDTILLCGFGVGLSWGATIITYGGSL